ncbi:hypothetical protein C8Q74DRAFT_257960 [Fomes fomentarius]|nr:hypothetical protein C8Q74DRAFT_257960 [Fomes fomentarius]
MHHLSTQRVRQGMQTSRLPIQICEHVIDACHDNRQSAWQHETCYRTWCQTALVCYDWLPRSQLNLFRNIDIHSASHLDLLLRTLSDAPHLADLVSGVRIASRKSEYIPFDRLLNSQLLRNCIRVNLMRIPWKASYQYADRNLYPLRSLGITHFAVELEQGSCASLLHCLYTLPLLQDLTLSAASKTVHIPDNVLAILHNQPCPFNDLRKLRLWSWASKMNFPPFLFPYSITHLVLDVSRPGVSGMC